jgi:hypothetical protein
MRTERRWWSDMRGDERGSGRQFGGSRPSETIPAVLEMIPCMHACVCVCVCACVRITFAPLNKKSPLSLRSQAHTFACPPERLCLVLAIWGWSYASIISVSSYQTGCQDSKRGEKGGEKQDARSYETSACKPACSHERTRMFEEDVIDTAQQKFDRPHPSVSVVPARHCSEGENSTCARMQITDAQQARTHKKHTRRRYPKRRPSASMVCCGVKPIALRRSRRSAAALCDIATGDNIDSATSLSTHAAAANEESATPLALHFMQ